MALSLAELPTLCHSSVVFSVLINFAMNPPVRPSAVLSSQLALGYRLDRSARNEGSLFVVDLTAVETQSMTAVPQ